MPEFTVESLLAYLRQYGGSYSLAELRRYMAEQGASPERIEEAVALYRAEGGSAASKPSGPAILLGCLAGFGLGVVSGLLLFFAFIGYFAQGEKVAVVVLSVLGIGTGLFALWVGFRPLFRKRG